MNFKFIRSYRILAPLLDGPYNDPEKDVDYNEVDFEKEYENVRKGIQELVNSYCESLGISSDLIDVGHRTGPTRGIGLFIEEEAAGSILALIEKIQGYLQTLSKDYCVPINLILDEEGDFKDLNIAITKSNDVLVRAKRREWLHEIGIEV